MVLAIFPQPRRTAVIANLFTSVEYTGVNRDYLSTQIYYSSALLGRRTVSRYLDSIVTEKNVLSMAVQSWGDRLQKSVGANHVYKDHAPENSIKEEELVLLVTSLSLSFFFINSSALLG